MLSNVQIIALAALFASTAVRRTEQGLIDALEAAGAVTPDTAIELPLSHFLKQWLFARLLKGGAAGETPQGTRYLDVVGYATYRRRRRMRAFVVIGIALAVALFAYYRSTNP